MSWRDGRRERGREGRREGAGERVECRVLCLPSREHQWLHVNTWVLFAWFCLSHRESELVVRCVNKTSNIKEKMTS